MKNINSLAAIFILLVAFLLHSCKAMDQNEIVIIGYVKNIPAKKIYLTNAYEWDTFLDSSIYENAKFQFTLDSSKFSEPFLASICFKKANNEIEQLGIIDYKKTTLKDTFSNTGFMLSWGKLAIFGDYNDKLHRVSIRNDKENDLHFDLRTENFGSKKNMKFLEKTINKNSSSYFLLQQLYAYKRLYTSNELRHILLLFDRKIQNSQTASELRLYAGYLTEKNTSLPNPLLNNSQGKRLLLFKDTSKLQMLIFWASWCYPCRMEIPQLRVINAKFSPNSLSMKSISIDESTSKWLTALNQEKMEWQQFLIPDKDLFKVKAQFSVHAVPTVIFVGPDRKEIKRFTGFYENDMEEYNVLINQYLSTIKKIGDTIK